MSLMLQNDLWAGFGACGPWQPGENAVGLSNRVLRQKPGLKNTYIPVYFQGEKYNLAFYEVFFLIDLKVLQ